MRQSATEGTDEPAGGASDRRPRILWISDEPPDRSLGGGNIRQAHIVEGLARVADVTLLAMGGLRDDAVRAAVGEVIEVPFLAPPAPSRRVVRRMHDLWIAVRGPREVVITAARRRRLRPVVRAREAEFDLVVACHPGMGRLRPRRPRTRWAIELQHVSSVQALQEREVTVGRRQRWLLSRQAGHARAFERWAVRSFDPIIVVSDEDAVLLGAGARAPAVLVAPNGVDTHKYAPSPLPPAPAVVMTGSFQYHPNIDGAVWFCREVLPLVRAVVPEVTLDLVGREPRFDVVALADLPGVSVHPDVPDMAPWLAMARVTVVPLRFGTGTRLKALESMAAGRPVVGTTVGLEGLGIEHGRHVLVADEAAAMADAIVRLLTDDELAASLVAAGRALVEERFEWSAIADRLAACVIGRLP